MSAQPERGHECSFCGASTNKFCGGCNAALFCSRSCQKSAWPGHRATCRELSAAKIISPSEPAALAQGAPSSKGVAAVTATVRSAAGADDGSDDDVWGVPWSKLLVAPALLPIEPAMMVGGAVFTQHVWYHGHLSPSAALAARFRAAHAAARAGMPGLIQTSTEQKLLEHPVVVFGTPRGGGGSNRAKLTSEEAMWMQGVRFAATPLDSATVRAIVQYAKRLRRSESNDPDHSNNAGSTCSSGVFGITEALAPAAAQMLEWALNTPPYSAAYALCVGKTPPRDDVVITSEGELDEALLDAATRRIVRKPTPAQCCLSRLACFSCGAHPLAKGVRLSVCCGCESVAYCGELCATADWTEHHRECARTRPRESRDPRFTATALPAHDLATSRGATELSKPTAFQTPIALPPASAGMWAPYQLTQVALIPTKGVDMLVKTNMWLVNGGAGGGIKS